jgi:hypothetical protein
MRLGVPTSERYCWPARENPDRHESLAELGQSAERGGHRSYPLVRRLALPTTPDPAIMAYAADNGLVILTNDLDFGIALAIANTLKSQASCRYAERISDRRPSPTRW